MRGIIYLCLCRDAPRRERDGPWKERHTASKSLTCWQSPCGTIQRQFCKAPNGPSVQELQHGLNILEVSTAAQHQGNAYVHVSACRWSRARLLLFPASHCSCFYLIPAHLTWCIASVLLLKENWLPPDTTAPGNYRTLPSYNSQKQLKKSYSHAQQWFVYSGAEISLKVNSMQLCKSLRCFWKGESPSTQLIWTGCYLL